MRLDPDIKALKHAIKALDLSTSKRMLIANFEFLFDRYITHPAKAVPSHLKKGAFVFCLLLTGYLLGTIEQPSHAESVYGYDSNGGSFSAHQSAPGAPTYYYGSDGTSGSFHQSPGSSVPSTKNPC